MLLSILVIAQLVVQTNGKYIRTSRLIAEDQNGNEEAVPVEDAAEDMETSEEVVEEEGADEEVEQNNEETDPATLEEQIDEFIENEILPEKAVEEIIDAIEDGTYYDEGQEDDYYEDEDLNEDSDAPKPIMHTFYQWIDPAHHHRGNTTNQGTGMSTDQAHLDLLATWTYAWEDAGFETKILNIEDVKRHEKYDKIRDFLDHEAFGEYDELCFLRWFAMATVGGGWMSDYDVVPLKSLVPSEYFGVPKRLSKRDIDGNNGIPLPHKGKFAVYDTDGRVPSLMSGSQKEWERLAQALLDLAHDHTEDFYSDMFALGDYSQKMGNAYIRENQVVAVLATVISTEGKIDCEKVWKMEKEHYWAVHFSHSNIYDAVEQGIIDEGVTPDDRPWIAREFIEDWKKQCSESFKDSE